MKKLLIGFAILVVLVAAAAAAVPYLVNLESQKDRLADLVRERTGRTLTVAGPVRLSILPRPALRLEDVGLSNAPEGTAEDMVRLGRLNLALDPVPLLSGEIAVRRLELVEPEIALEIDAAGRPNWRFDSAAGAPGAGSTEASSGTGGRNLPRLALPAVEIVDGRLSWNDARTGARYVVEDLDATLAAPSMEAPVVLDAGFDYGGRRVSLDAEGAEFGALLAGEPTVVSLDAGSDALRVAFEGRIAAGAEPSASGRVSVAAPSAAEAAAWLGTGPAQLPEGTVSIVGDLAAEPAHITLAGATFEAVGERAQGDLAVALGGSRPAVSGRLAFGRVDVDRLRAALGGVETEEPVPGGDTAAPASTPSGAEAPARVPVPIEVGFLRTVDADLDISLDGVLLDGIESGPTTAAIDLAGGRLGLDLADTPVFEGTVAMRASLDGSGDVPQAEMELRVSGVQARPLLAATADFDRLSGATQGTVTLRAAGATDQAMLADLDGAGSVLFTDGAVEGVNIAAMLRNALATLRGEPAPEADAPQRTDFAELGAGFRIVDGVARTDDLRMLAPLVRMTGEGTVDLPARTVDMRLTPRLVADLEGQGGQADRSGLAVPILVRGDFERLAFAPDLEGLAREAIRDPASIGRRVEELRDAVRSGEPEEAVKRLLEGIGGGQPSDTGGDAPAPPANPLEQLRGLFNR